MRRLFTKPRITSHVRDRILAAFPSIAEPYMSEKPCIFSYVLCWTNGTVRRFIYMKNDTVPDIGVCHARVHVFMHQLNDTVPDIGVCHARVHVFMHQLNDSVPDIGMCHARVHVFMHLLQTSSCSLVRQAVRANFEFLLCDSLLRKTVSGLAGIRSSVVFYLPCLNSLG